MQLPSAQDVAEVRARIEVAGQEVEPVEGGFFVRDPWQTAVTFVEATP